MRDTDNYALNLYDGSDKFNPLTVENENMETIDSAMYENFLGTVGIATELKSGTVHALTRANGDVPMIRFTATANYTAGDTFTVDGVQVTALTPSGEALGDGAYIIGSEVIGCLKGTLLTLFISGGAITTADNALKLGGEEPSYYGTAEAVALAQQTATASGVLANSVQTQVTELANKMPALKLLWENPNPSAVYSEGSVTLDSNDYDYLIVLAREYSGRNILVSGFALKNHGFQLTNFDASYVHSRAGTVDAGGLSVNFQHAYISGGAPAINDNHLIPYRIYGSKFGV